MDFKWLLISQRSQSEKTTYFSIILIWPSGKGKTTDIIGQVVKVWGGGLMEKAQWIFNGSEWKLF